jgi:hypothetical protein
MKTLLIVAAAVVVGSVSPLLAQGEAPDPSNVKVRIGPLWMNPAIALNNIGIDNNVFNDPATVPGGPKKDFTFTLSPNTLLWLRMGRTWITGEIDEDIVWYQKYSSERSGNTVYGIGWKVPLNRLSFTVGAKRINTRARPGFEIDARAQRSETPYIWSGEFLLLSKTYVGFSGSYEKTDFAAGDVFQGINLQQQLNRTDVSNAVTLRHQLTPLTSITFSAGRETATFEFTPLRNTTSTSYSASVSFDPAALLKGGATFGYTNFKPDDPSVPGYTGTTASVNLSYTFAGSTKLGAVASRGVNYSYDITQPYYVQTGVTGSVGQQLFGPVDVIAHLGIQYMAYRDQAGVVVQVANRTDSVLSYGLGFGYHFGKDLRFGVNANQDRRRSLVAAREYEGWQIGTAITYGQ